MAYCKTIIRIEGYIVVQVRYNRLNKDLHIYLTNLEKEPLMGREWIRQLSGRGGVPDLLGCNALLESTDLNKRESGT